MTSLTLGRAVLEGALAQLQSIVDSKVSIPILSNLKIASVDQVLTVTATNLESTIVISVLSDQVNVTKAGIVLAPAKQLYDLVRLFPDGPVTLSIDPKNDWLNIQVNRNSYRVPSPSPEMFPQAANASAVSWLEIPASLLRGLIDGVGFVVQKGAQAQLAGAQLEITTDEVTMASTDGLRIAIASAPHDGLLPDDLEVLVPSEGLTALKQLLVGHTGTIDVGVNDANIFFKTNRFLFSTRRSTTKFPNYKPSIPVGRERQVRVSATELTSALRRALLFVNNEINRSARIEVADGKLIISGVQKEGASCHEEVPCVSSARLHFGVNVSFLLEFTSLFSEQLVFELEGPDKSILLRPEALVGGISYRYLLMPVRLD